MTSADDLGPHGGPQDPPDLRIGTPERQAARDALEAHLIDKRLDSTEYEQRVQACELARTQAELLRIFDDLPAPRPELPSAAVPPTTPDHDENMPPVAVAGCLTLGLGLPVAVVLGFMYQAWWALAVPVAVTAAMAYVEHLRARPGRHEPEREPDPSE